MENIKIKINKQGTSRQYTEIYQQKVRSFFEV